jgi:hypothetical protein
MAYGKSMMGRNRSKQMSSGQKQIAGAAKPKDKITGADFKALRKRKA